MNRISSRALAIIVIAVAVGLIGYFILRTGASILQYLFGDWRQIVVAIAAAAIMFGVGIRLTMGRSTFAAAGQQEKIAIWAALLMSVVSAITTSSGLLLVLSPSPQTGAILMVIMALLLGVGIQLSMLMYALRIGEGIQRLSPVSIHDQELHGEEPAPNAKSSINLGNVVLLMVLLGLAIGMFVFGQTLRELAGNFLTALYETDASKNPIGVQFVGFAAFVLVAALAIQFGFVTRPGTLFGLVFSLAIYGMLLLFSSGFGYISYFMASQSDEVRAIDRDNVIETQTPALVRQIQDAAREDVREALLEARSGDDYQDLSQRIDTLSSLFVANQDELNDQIVAHEARRQQIIDAKNAAASSVQNAEGGVSRARQEIATAGRALARVQENHDAKLPELTKNRDTAAAEAIKAENGEDGTGIQQCGPICRDAQRRAASWNDQIKDLDAELSAALAAVEEAKAREKEAARILDSTKNSNEGLSFDDPIPPVIVDRTSFEIPRNEYSFAPSIPGLVKIAQTCTSGRDMMISLGLKPNDLPGCDISQVEVWLVRHKEGEAALAAMQDPCRRTDDELAREEMALADGFPNSITTIPVHLRDRLAWVGRCLTAANTGSERMNDAAIAVNQLESEFATPEYDTRRALRSLGERNLFSLFAAIMAVVVDTAILFAGFAANASRARDLAEDPNLVSADRVADRIRNALATVSPERPNQAALAFLSRSQSRTASEIGQGPYGQKISLDVCSATEARAFKLILDAAGPKFAPYAGREGSYHYLLHNNLVSMLTEAATQGSGAPSGRGAFVERGGTFRFAADAARAVPNVTPVFKRVQVAGDGLSEGKQSPYKGSEPKNGKSKPARKLPKTPDED